MSNQKALAKIVLEHENQTTQNEATAYPIWVIVRKHYFRYVYLDGFWFNRIDAQNVLDSRRHFYDTRNQKAFVYCFSGHVSKDIKSLYELARA